MIKLNWLIKNLIMSLYLIFYVNLSNNYLIWPWIRIVSPILDTIGV